jgi:hypothetical protein
MRHPNTPRVKNLPYKAPQAPKNFPFWLVRWQSRRTNQNI